MTVRDDKPGASVVERAARRLEAERGTSPPSAPPRSDVPPRPDAPPRPDLSPRPDAERKEPQLEAAMRARAQMTEPAGEAASGRLGREIVPTHPTPRPAGRVEIDMSRLPTVGIYAPEITSNRTTEEFRLIKHAAMQRVAKAAEAGVRNARLIMVTSSRESEGKSFVAANLAMSLAAEKDRSVLLIDADASRSSISHYFGFKAERGLLDALDGEDVAPSEVLLETNIKGLMLLPAGPRRALSAELYASDLMGKFLERLMRDYPTSIVVFDAPPVLATGEPSALAQHMGQIVFVVESERTSQSTIAEALQLINICPSIGFVFNKARFRFGSVRFGSYYGYYAKQ